MSAVYRFANRKTFNMSTSACSLEVAKCFFCDRARQSRINKALRKTEGKLEKLFTWASVGNHLFFAIWGKLVSQLNQSSNLPPSNFQPSSVSSNVRRAWTANSPRSCSKQRIKICFYLFISLSLFWWLPNYQSAELWICRYPTDLTPVPPINCSSLLCR